jgi:Na+/H+ antiporter
MGKTELILICLLGVAFLAIVARRWQLPFPVLLTLGGVALALIPGLPRIELEPNLVFDLFLPPLIYPAAVWTSWRDFRGNLRPILWLAVGLVLATMAAVAVVFHYLTGLPLAVGFVFGAIISPPDAVAALSVTQQLRIPRRVVVILEGESLANDAASFISFRFAVAAVLMGTFSLGQAAMDFLLVAAGGIVVGLAVGWLAIQLQRRLDDPPVQTMFSLLTPYVAYFTGEQLHVSGILAVVIAGMSFGWRAPAVLSGRMRLHALPVWEMVLFALNGMLFMLIGLQLPDVIRSRPAGSPLGFAKLTLLVLGTMILVRFAWMFSATFVPRVLGLNLGRQDRTPWKHTVLLAWTGMRGADSLAGALAIPLVIAPGQPFPGRDLILLLTFAVIFVTLLLQGPTVAPLLRWLKVTDDGVTEREEHTARLRANEAALARLDAIQTSSRARPEAIQRLRSEYLDRIEQLRNGAAGSDIANYLFLPDFEALAREALDTERETVIRLRNDEVINDHALRRIQRDIDLAEARLRRPRRRGR